MSKILKSYRDTHGYPTVGLYRDGKRKMRNIHVLMAKEFLVKKNSNDVVNHINGIKSDNNIDNIEFVSQRENILHAYRLGLNKQRCGREHERFKGEIQVFKNGRLEMTLCGKKDIEAAGFNFSRVYECARGVLKTYKGYTFTRV